MMKIDKDGFTLVEVLTVLVIIAILSSVALPVMGGIVKQSKSSAYVEEARRVAETAQALMIELYAEGTYDSFEFAAVAFTSMDSRTNPVAQRMKKGSYTPGARIKEVGMSEITLKLNYMEYHVNSQKILIDFRNGKVVYK